MEKEKSQKKNRFFVEFVNFTFVCWLMAAFTLLLVMPIIRYMFLADTRSYIVENANSKPAWTQKDNESYQNIQNEITTFSKEGIWENFLSTSNKKALKCILVLVILLIEFVLILLIFLCFKPFANLFYNFIKRIKLNQ